ncbi:hypothetical protein [Tateyamaria sp. ANG-S1]|uniref:hypothetical protein n=1 Tax=Tateyamaria sp. ANG-S1 TaxID=1577905 RepID=UPI00058246E9|nr:hypothetical protein [Tateyamaria sp. ANG-S1]KIC50417.1 hypothetical protein RA29_06840 [Tateyamaria sp. ANG-S1]
MCLTTEALAAFLNILGMAYVTGDAHTITVHATAGDVEWHYVVNEWCTGAPHATPASFLAQIDPQYGPETGR